jgi:CBS domain-containing protein
MNSSTHTQSVPDRLKSRLAGEYASNGIVACSGAAPLGEVAGLMARNNVHAIVVVDDQAVEPPVVSDQDLVDAVASGHFDELTAADIARSEAVSIFADEDLGRAAQLLAEHRVTHLVVRNVRREPVGIVSALDLAEAASGFGRPPRDRAR